MSSSTEDTEPRTLRVIHAVHPDTQDIFRKFAVPKETLKTNKGTIEKVCTNCGTILKKLSVCQRVCATECKSVWYCTKECQKKDWLRHKETCTPVERSSGITKFPQTIIANTLLLNTLALCAAIDLDLVNDKRRLGFDVPFVGQINVGMEPSGSTDLHKLLFTKELANSKTEGMVQFNRFMSYIPGQFGYSPLEPRQMAVWNQIRAQSPKDARVGMLEFVYNVNLKQSTMVNFCVHPEHLLAAKRAEPFTHFSGITGAKVVHPMSVVTCLEFMNTHVRADKQNQLQLRTDMTESDMDIIRGVMDRANNSEAVCLLREKINREGFYGNLSSFM
ncbi:hypothetical protein F5I97DRAFT_1422712 [Phlebopus sp. FC_14]|nr:hypothetical protein F5I97DRAFT_1422712 [Phlebopus sp. FC_14]